MRRNGVALGALALLAACSRRDERPRAEDLAKDTVPVLIGAGDIADCRNDGAVRTAEILDTLRGTIFVAGDAAYATKKNRDPLHTCYAPTWGRHRARTRPTPGNHEYENGRADQYFAYFGEAAGPRDAGYYSYELGDWHVVALNTNIPFDSGSAQHTWLAQDLAKHAGQCAVAYMHHPRFSSGPHEDHERIAPLWNTLAEHGVTIVIAGHDHIYERFAPLDTAGRVDTDNGMRQFVVGTGGADSYRIKRVLDGSEASSGYALGVLKVSLLPGRYRWEFVPADRGGFRDSGESPCRAMHAER